MKDWDKVILVLGRERMLSRIVENPMEGELVIAASNGNAHVVTSILQKGVCPNVCWVWIRKKKDRRDWNAMEESD